MPFSESVEPPEVASVPTEPVFTAPLKTRTMAEVAFGAVTLVSPDAIFVKTPNPYPYGAQEVEYFVVKPIGEEAVACAETPRHTIKSPGNVPNGILTIAGPAVEPPSSPPLAPINVIGVDSTGVATGSGNGTDGV